MNEILTTSIKEVIQRYPRVAGILDEYEIGCVSCSLGTCQLKDIISIHDLAPESGDELITRIMREIYPNVDITIPKIERAAKPEKGNLQYSPPMKKLVDEHVLIKRLLAAIPGVIHDLEVETEAGRRQVLEVVDFIQSYADKHHHAKEEAILFKFFDENMDIIKTMYADHENARSKVRGILTALDNHDRETIARLLDDYRQLLTEHIQKEDEILYRWMDRNLTTSQIGQMFARFNEKDLEAGDKQKRYKELVSNIENKNLVKGEAK